ncbi:hypothetical protein V3C99_011521 [Haemonchus contortus]
MRLRDSAGLRLVGGERICPVCDPFLFPVLICASVEAGNSEKRVAQDEFLLIFTETASSCSASLAEKSHTNGETCTVCCSDPSKAMRNPFTPSYRVTTERTIPSVRRVVNRGGTNVNYFTWKKCENRLTRAFAFGIRASLSALFRLRRAALVGSTV